MEGGSNMKVLAGLSVGQESGMALRLSSVAGALMSCFEVEEVSWELLAASRASRLRWAIWRGAGILFPAHIQAYFSAF